MIRILHVVAKMDPAMGGVSQAVRTIVTGLNEKGVFNEIISLDLPDAPFLKTTSIPINALGTKEGAWSYSSLLYPWLMKNLPGFDTIMVHGLWQYHTYAVMKAMRQLRKLSEFKHRKKDDSLPKLFVMPHGMLDPYFQRAKGRKIKAIRNFIFWKLIENTLINGADGILFTGEEERRLAREPFRPYHPKKEIVIGLGVEAPPHYNEIMKDAFLQKCPQLKNSSYIIFLGRIHEKKGVDILIKAYAALIEKTNDAVSIPKLVIAGPGIDTAYGRKIERMALQTKQLSGNIYFAGMLTGNAKWGAFYGCEAFVLPSHQENFGIAVVEAMACKKMVLISNEVNIWREIATVGGCIVSDDTMEGTLQMLEHLYKLNCDEKLKMCQQAGTAYENLFTIESATNRLLNALNNINE